MTYTVISTVPFLYILFNYFITQSNHTKSE